MKTFRSALCYLLLAVAALCAAGCNSTGTVAEGRVKFGIPAVFSVEKTISNLSVSETATRTKVAVADTETHVQIGLFTWESSAKDAVVSTRREKEKEK